MTYSDDIEAILAYWFGDLPSSDHYPEEKSAIWFKKSDATDDEIRSRFGGLVESAVHGKLDDWAASARGRLALIILLDQFTRNIYRGEARMYDGDARCLGLTR